MPIHAETDVLGYGYSFGWEIKFTLKIPVWVDRTEAAIKHWVSLKDKSPAAKNSGADAIFAAICYINIRATLILEP